MKYVKLSDARANIEALFDEIERGETVIITLGAATAQTVRRVEELRRADEENKERRRQAMRDLRELKKGAGIATIEELLEWRDEVRK